MATSSDPNPTVYLNEKSEPLGDGQTTPTTATCPVTGQSSDGAGCPMSGPQTQHIDADLLNTSLDARIAYLKAFLGFGQKQADIINKIAPLVKDLIPAVVDDIYSKLFEFDVTKQVFMERNEGFDGPLPETMDELTLDSSQIIYRKVFMRSWARRVLTSDYTSDATWKYMDKVGIMHTGVKSFKHRAQTEPLVVPYRDCALSLGWVLTVLQTAVLKLDDDAISMSDKIDAIGSINQVIWIQNDLFARHYINE